MSKHIETVDLSSPSAAADLDRGLRAKGFVQLVNHGLAPELREAMITASDTFFALDKTTKSAFIHPESAANRGYRAKGSEALSYSLGEASPPDLFESFNSGPPPAAGNDSQLLADTPWPHDEVPALSTAALDYFHAASALASRLDVMVGEVIGAPWLAERSGQGTDTLASIHYRPGPDGTEEAVEGQQRMGAHSDYSSFTLLDADPVPGLQIVDSTGEWIGITPDEGAILMNVGDLLAVLTNDAWPSVLHRVVPMSAGAAPVKRSLAFFHYPNLDVEVATLPGFITNEHPEKYAAVTVEAHLTDKLLAPKERIESTGISTTGGRI